MNNQENTDVYSILKKLEIAFTEVMHDPVYTVAEAQKVKARIAGVASPFCIFHDKGYKAVLVIGSDLKNQRLLFHPNINTKTLSIDYNDLLQFIVSTGHQFYFL